jgi:hypothetical protein
MFALKKGKHIVLIEIFYNPNRFPYNTWKKPSGFEFKN